MPNRIDLGLVRFEEWNVNDNLVEVGFLPKTNARPKINTIYDHTSHI